MSVQEISVETTAVRSAERKLAVPARISAKRLFDVMGAASLLAVLLPLFGAIALLIKFDSRGPIFFRQCRIGLGGKPFAIFKFRTMHVLEDGDVCIQEQPNDPRVTRIGRLLRTSSLDELPQLLNVLRGEMSLVGPRPHARAHDEEFERLVTHYATRRSVKPGLTGWAQVNGSHGPTVNVDHMRRRAELDLWYARHASLALDLRILVRTPRAILTRRSAA